MHREKPCLLGASDSQGKVKKREGKQKIQSVNEWGAKPYTLA